MDTDQIAGFCHGSHMAVGPENGQTGCRIHDTAAARRVAARISPQPAPCQTAPAAACSADDGLSEIRNRTSCRPAKSDSGTPYGRPPRLGDNYVIDEQALATGQDQAAVHQDRVIDPSVGFHAHNSATPHRSQRAANTPQADQTPPVQKRAGRTRPARNPLVHSRTTTLPRLPCLPDQPDNMGVKVGDKQDTSAHLASLPEPLIGELHT